MTYDPNTRQVGGDHYKRVGMQHWDLAALADAGYFAGQVTKYTERHAKKNGRQDLEKALHFAEKMHSLNTETFGEGHTDGWGRSRSVFKRMERRAVQKRPVSQEVIQAIRDYAVDSGLTAIQERIFELCFLQPHKTEDIVLLCKKHLDREYGPTLVQDAPVALDPPPMREGPIPAVAFGREGVDYAHAPRQANIFDADGAYHPGTPEDGGHYARDAELDSPPEETPLPPEVESALTQDLQALMDEQLHEQASAAEVVAPFKPKRGGVKQRG